MGIFRTWEKWGENVGNGTKDFLQDTGDAIVKNVCGLYGKYPKKLVISPYARGFMGGFCDDSGEPLPPPDIRTFEGGECEGVDYYVSLQVNSNPDGSPSLRQKTVPGAITGELRYAFFGKYGSQNETYGYRILIGHTGGFYNSGALIFVPAETTPPGNNVVRINSVRRVDGQPDNCGEVEPDFDPNDFNKTVFINNYNNNGDVINENEYEINIPIDIGENFNVCLDVGGMKICVGLDGYGAEDGQEDAEEDNKEELNDCNFDEIENEDDEEKEEDEKKDPEIKWVVVEITTLPEKGKTILQEKEEDNTYFAGYFSWFAEVNGEQIRITEDAIRKKRMAFKRPVDAVGYRAYTVNKAKLKLTAYKETIKTEEERKKCLKDNSLETE